jgi:methylmalonyl-CoA/ethylmalonyl-CoA epimerase
LIRIHHIGYVVRDIERFQSSFPGLEFINAVEDPLQNARLALYTVGDGSRIELIQPHNVSAFTWAHLDRVGEGMHHICYEGLSIDDIDTVLKQHRLMKVRGPMKAVLFDRDVIFAITRQRAIVEFIL